MNNFNLKLSFFINLFTRFINEIPIRTRNKNVLQNALVHQNINVCAGLINEKKKHFFIENIFLFKMCTVDSIVDTVLCV